LLAFGDCQPLVRRHFNQGRCSDCISTNLHMPINISTVMTKTRIFIYEHTLRHGPGCLRTHHFICSRDLACACYYPELASSKCRLLHSAAATAARQETLSPRSRRRYFSVQSLASVPAPLPPLCRSEKL
jgi:hypothetical protein